VIKKLKLEHSNSKLRTN